LPASKEVPGWRIFCEECGYGLNESNSKKIVDGEDKKTIDLICDRCRSVVVVTFDKRKR
jgi:hypothetical protein